MQNHAGAKTPDVCPECDLGGSFRGEEGDGAGSQLGESPKTQVDYSRYLNQVKEEKYRDQCKDPSFGEHEEISAHDSGQGTGSAYCRNRGMRVDVAVGGSGNDPAGQVKQDKTNRAHLIFYIVAEQEQGPHVADDVHPASMEKSAGDERGKRMISRDQTIGVKKLLQFF